MTDDDKKASDDVAEHETATPKAGEQPEAAEAQSDAAPARSEAAALEKTEAAPPAAPRPSRLPALIAGLALLVAIAAAGLSAWQLLRPQAPDPLAIANESTLAEAAEARQALSRAIDDTSRDIEALRSTARDAAAQAESVGRELESRLRPLEALPGRLSGLESSLSALQGISSGLRDTWLLSEAEYYLQIANAQLQLASNAPLARIALDLADERLASLGNPALTDVRRSIASEIRQLDAMGDVDLEGAAHRLSSLADAVADLPLKDDMVEPDFDSPAVDEELSGGARAMASLKAALSDVISVRRSDQPVEPLLPPDAAYFLKSNVILQLQAARLALLRGEQALFNESLDDAASWIGEYYDTETTPVTSALDTIRELRNTEFRQPAPDISGSLALLRQYMSLRSERGLAPAEDNDDNGTAQ